MPQHHTGSHEVARHPSLFSFSLFQTQQEVCLQPPLLLNNLQVVCGFTCTLMSLIYYNIQLSVLLRKQTPLRTASFLQHWQEKCIFFPLILLFLLTKFPVPTVDGH